MLVMVIVLLITYAELGQSACFAGARIFAQRMEDLEMTFNDNRECASRDQTCEFDGSIPNLAKFFFIGSTGHSPDFCADDMNWYAVTDACARCVA